MKLAYYVHGRGQGHAIRTLPIAKALQAAGHQTRVFGSIYSRPLQAFADFEPIALDSRSRFFPRLAGDIKRLRRDRPDVVLSDGDAPSLNAARLLGIPTITVGHGLIFARCELPAGLPRWALQLERWKVFPVSVPATFAVAAHFLPIQANRLHTRVARPVRRGTVSTSKVHRDKVVCYFRDSNGHAAVEYAVQAGADVICYSDPPMTLAGADCRGFDSDGFTEALQDCSAVIASSGSNLCAEAIMLRKPLLALYRSRDSEQLLNSLLIEQSSVGMSAALENLDAKLVMHFLRQANDHKFQTIDLENSLPDVASAVLQTLDDVL